MSWHVEFTTQFHGRVQCDAMWFKRYVVLCAQSGLPIPSHTVVVHQTERYVSHTAVISDFQ